MSRTHKINRSREAHAKSKVWVSAFNASRADLNSDATSRRLAQETLDQLSVNRSQEREDEFRTGPRYGNQRKMRARCDQAARRADRKQDPSPLVDIDGEVGLESRPASPARRRGPRWTA